jgi:hypothetical protein
VSEVVNEVHVKPRNDLIQHDSTEDCPCGPTAKPVKRADGSIGWVFIHPSLDGREPYDEEEP